MWNIGSFTNPCPKRIDHKVYANFTETFCGSYGYAAPEVNPRRQVPGRVKVRAGVGLILWFIGDYIVAYF